MALAMVGVDATIGKASIVNANATIDQDASLGAFAHLGRVHLAGGVKVYMKLEAIQLAEIRC